MLRYSRRGLVWVLGSGVKKEDSTSMMTTPSWHLQGLLHQDLKISRLKTRIQNTLLGEGWLMGTLEQPVDSWDAWRSAMTSCGKLHPDSKRWKNTSCPKAYLCNRKSLWALAWLTLVVTLANGASRCRTTVGLDEHRTVVRGTLRKTMFRSSCYQTPWSART